MENTLYDYSPIIDRPGLELPNGARVAFWVGLNIEHYQVDKASTSIFGGTAGLQPDPLNYGWRDYGPRVGIWRSATCKRCLVAPPLGSELQNGTWTRTTASARGAPGLYSEPIDAVACRQIVDRAPLSRGRSAPPRVLPADRRGPEFPACATAGRSTRSS